MTIKFFHSLQLIVLHSALASSVMAQGQTKTAQETRPNVQVQKPAKTAQQVKEVRLPSPKMSDPHQYDSATISKQIDIPDVPHYSGKSRFINGTSFPNLHGSESYTLTFVTESDSKAVLDWYSQALSMNGWKVESQSEPKQEVRAERTSGAFCHVRARPRKLKDARTYVILMYTGPKK